MIIDCHVHVLGDYSKTTKEALAALDAAGVDRAVVMSDDPSEHPDVPTNTEYVLGLAREADGRIIPFVWLNPLADDVLEVLTWAEGEGIRGVKLIPHGWFPYDPPLLRVYEKIERLGLPILFHSGILWLWGDTSRQCRPTNFEILMEYPGIRFALGHCSWPWCYECFCVINKIRNLRKQRGLDSHQAFGDLTPGMPEDQRQHMVNFALNFIGDEHLIFGTDDVVGGDYGRTVVESFQRVFDQLDLPQETRGKIWYKNALRWLGEEG